MIVRFGVYDPSSNSIPVYSDPQEYNHNGAVYNYMPASGPTMQWVQCND